MTPLRELYEYYNYPKAATEERRRALLEEIAPDERDEDNGGRTSLHLAAEFADTEAIAQLAARGADIEARDDEGCTPLLRLAMRRGEKSIRATGSPMQAVCCSTSGPACPARDAERRP